MSKFFFEKVFFLISRFMLFSTLKILKSASSNFRGGGGGGGGGGGDFFWV